MLWEKVLSCLLFVNPKCLSPILGTLSTILVNKYGLVLLNPVTDVKTSYISFQGARK